MSEEHKEIETESVSKEVMTTIEKSRGLKKKFMIIAATVGILFVVMVGIYFTVLKPPFETAIQSYKKCLLEYEKVTLEYNNVCSNIESINNGFTEKIEKLQKLVSLGEKPFDDGTITKANDAINTGKVALVQIPELKQYDIKPADEYNVFQTSQIRSDKEKLKMIIQEISDNKKSLTKPDYSKEIEQIEEAHISLDNSIKQLKQVTCPTEAFVLERITEIKEQAGMVDIVALTEDNDPENHIGKAGWYTSKIIFQHKDVEHYAIVNGLRTLAEIGNPAGGCVETYSTVEDAERRNAELAGMEGTVRSPGAHEVCGTLVIRVSEDMKTSTQQELMEMIKNTLLRL